MLRNSLFNLRSGTSLINNSLPFSVPSLANNVTNYSTASSLLKGASKFSFTGILDNASKTINTINQIVPLYNQVKPMISNAKTALNIFKNVNKINNEPINTSINTNIDKNIELAPKKEESKEPQTIILNKTNPNKPFFA